MRQLRERITQHFNLAPLKAGEVGNYIEFRLRAAGYHGPNPFTTRAVELIARLSEGLSRRINILADKALLAAYSGGGHQVDAAEVKIAAQDARFAPIQQKTAFNLTPFLKWALGGGLVVALLGVGVVLVVARGRALEHLQAAPGLLEGLLGVRGRVLRRGRDNRIARDDMRPGLRGVRGRRMR